MIDQPLPLIYISNQRTIYLGRSYLPLREIHSGAAWLLTCLEGSVRFRANDSIHWITAKSLLISAGTKISIDTTHAIISVCYLNSEQADYQTLKLNMRSANSNVYYNYRFEEQLISELTAFRDDEPEFEEAQERMHNIIYAHHTEHKAGYTVDPRIKHVISRLKDTAELNIPVKEFANEVCISESGLIKLFRKQVGTPIRKHRLWFRLINFITYRMAGKTTNEAISLAGFSDISHLSKCYSRLIGIPLSTAFSRPAKIHCIVSDSELQRASTVQIMPLAALPTPQVIMS